MENICSKHIVKWQCFYLCSRNNLKLINFMYYTSHVIILFSLARIVTWTRPSVIKYMVLSLLFTLALSNIPWDLLCKTKGVEKILGSPVCRSILTCSVFTANPIIFAISFVLQGNYDRWNYGGLVGMHGIFHDTRAHRHM